MVARIRQSDRGVDPRAYANTFTAILQTKNAPHPLLLAQAVRQIVHSHDRARAAV